MRSASPFLEARTDGAPTTTSGPRPGSLARQSEADTNGRPVPCPTYGVMKCLNFATLPAVASANSTPDANGVWMLGRTAVSTVPTSWARSLSSRFSVSVYCLEDTQVNTPVTSSPTRTTPNTGHHEGPRPRRRIPARGRSLDTITSPRPSDISLHSHRSAHRPREPQSRRAAGHQGRCTWSSRPAIVIAVTPRSRTMGRAGSGRGQAMPAERPVEFGPLAAKARRRRVEHRDAGDRQPRRGGRDNNVRLSRSLGAVGALSRSARASYSSSV